MRSLVADEWKIKSRSVFQGGIFLLVYWFISSLVHWAKLCMQNAASNKPINQ